jgi:hypothetical protein
VDRFTVGIAGGVLLLVAAGLAAAALQRARSSPPDLSTPSGVVLAYALAEQRGDAEAAWNFLAPATQGRADKDRFLAAVGRTDTGTTTQYLSTEDERVDGDTASVVLVRTYAAAGAILATQSFSNRTTVRLTRDPGGWRITVPPDEYNLVSPPKP